MPLGLEGLVLYRKLLDDDVIQKGGQIWASIGTAQDNKRLAELYYGICYQLIINSQQGGNLWRNYILDLILSDENVFSLGCENSKKTPISSNLYNLAKHDFTILRRLFLYDWKPVQDQLKIKITEEINNFQPSAHKLTGYASYYDARRHELKLSFSNVPIDTLVHKVAGFYSEVGIGKLGKYAAYKWDNDLRAITDHDPVTFEELIGYDYQKEVLARNTEAFLNDRKANHILLYGSKGTGKSSSVKALLNRYCKAKLRMIELSKEQLAQLGDILQLIRHRGYYFIIFIDDLSFEDFEVQYKHIKSSIEGSLEVTPDNVLIYATSNRRHLIKETWAERQEPDEVHGADAQQEKLSLVDRFGITLSFESPAQEEYLTIVSELAQRNGLQVDAEELRRGALQWERKTHGRSGRTARQYINHLLTIEQKPSQVTEN